MKKGFLIASAVTLSILTTATMIKVNAQGPGLGNAPSRSEGNSGHGGCEKFSGPGADREGNPERQEFRQKMLQRFDTNHDGVLDDAERAQMKEAMQQHRQQSGGDFASGGDDKSGQRSGFGQQDERNSDNPQRQAFRQKMLQRFDGNHDGQLDDGEKAQMREFMQQRRMQHEGNGDSSGEKRP